MCDWCYSCELPIKWGKLRIQRLPPLASRTLMRKQNRFIRFVISAGVVLSLFGATVVAPSANVNAATFAIPSAKKVLSAEQKKAKSALNSARKELAKKEKALKKAIAAQKVTATNLSKLETAAKSTSTSTKKN